MTCDKKLKKKVVPCQAVCNKLYICEIPEELIDLRKLEKVIISQRILFKKVVIMPKGQSPKMKGTICNVPLEADDVCNNLPRGADSNGVIMLKLKRKHVFRGHVLFEPVRPHVVKAALLYLKLNNPLYAEITINMEQLNTSSIMQNENSTDENEQGSSTHDIPEEIEENPLDQHRLGCNETTLISEIPVTETENVSIAPCEGKNPLGVLSDQFCEELAHPYLFPTGVFGYKVDRKIKLSPSKYFNQRLLNYKQRFASEPDYIFFVHSIWQQQSLTNSINIAMKKLRGSQLTAGMLSRNFMETVSSFVASENAYSFMNTIKGTPAYWKRFLFEVLAMVKQLGLPTFFLTLSCADLRWNKLVLIIAKLNALDISDEDIDKIDYFERCKLLNSNPVLLARHFQYRVEVFFKEIIVDGPLGKVKYHAIRVEFQFRGSPHVHSFIWVIDAP